MSCSGLKEDHTRGSPLGVCRFCGVPLVQENYCTSCGQPQKEALRHQVLSEKFRGKPRTRNKNGKIRRKRSDAGKKRPSEFALKEES
jgi:ribosomal protein L37E